MITEDFVKRTAKDQNRDINKVRRALTRAFCTIPQTAVASEELVLRLARTYLDKIPKITHIPVEIVEDKSEKIEKNKKRGRKPLYRGKVILGGTKNTYRCWWEENGDMALDMARDDKYFPEAQIGGNYALVKEYLRNEWKNRFEFTLPELKQAMAEKYPEKARHSGFRLQRWGNASYWERSDGVAVKPLWKQIERKKYMNIFWIGDED